MRASVLALISGLMLIAVARPAQARPLLEVVKYGNHPQQYMLIYNAQGWFKPALKGPRPTMIFYHGGGFVGGAPDFGSLWWQFFTNEVTVVAPSYRLISDGATKREIMEDGARVVQFLRANAATYNIDPARMGVSGYSAGGTMAAWVAMHNDLADPANPDLVLRQSSRVKVCYLDQAQVHPLTLNEWVQYTGANRDLLNRTVYPYVVKNLSGGQFPAPFSPADFTSFEDFDFAWNAYQFDTLAFNHASADDPPLAVLTTASSNPAVYLNSWYDATGLHSPLLMIPLRNRLNTLKVPTYWGASTGTLNFVLTHLQK